jgi:acetate kinase
MKGLTGFSDLREISEKAEKGNKECQNALRLAAYRIKKYIGSYTSTLNGLDAIIFTAGIGENSALMRKLACENLDFLGINLDESKNAIRSKEIREIQTETSKVKIFVIPTNEEIEIAKQSYTLLT